MNIKDSPIEINEIYRWFLKHKLNIWRKGKTIYWVEDERDIIKWRRNKRECSKDYWDWWFAHLTG